MDKLIRHLILKELKEAGYEKANLRAVEEFKTQFEKYMNVTLKSVLSVTQHTLRANSTIIDVLNVLKMMKINLKDIKIKTRSPKDEWVNELEYIEEATQPTTHTSLATVVEKYIHIYDFMPQFPPVHTFRKSFSKEKKRDDRSKNVKTRIEQSLSSEANLLKMMKASRDIPSYVNYMYE